MTRPSTAAGTLSSRGPRNFDTPTVSKFSLSQSSRVRLSHGEPSPLDNISNGNGKSSEIYSRPQSARSNVTTESVTRPQSRNNSNNNNSNNNDGGVNNGDGMNGGKGVSRAAVSHGRKAVLTGRPREPGTASVHGHPGHTRAMGSNGRGLMRTRGPACQAVEYAARYGVHPHRRGKPFPGSSGDGSDGVAGFSGVRIGLVEPLRTGRSGRPILETPHLTPRIDPWLTRETHTAGRPRTARPASARGRGLGEEGGPFERFVERPEPRGVVGGGGGSTSLRSTVTPLDLRRLETVREDTRRRREELRVQSSGRSQRSVHRPKPPAESAQSRATRRAWTPRDLRDREPHADSTRRRPATASAGLPRGIFNPEPHPPASDIFNPAAQVASLDAFESWAEQQRSQPRGVRPGSVLERMLSQTAPPPVATTSSSASSTTTIHETKNDTDDESDEFDEGRVDGSEDGSGEHSVDGDFEVEPARERRRG